MLYSSITFIYGEGPRKCFRNFKLPFTPQTRPFDPNMHSNEISGSLRSPGCENFSTVRPLADEQIIKKRTLNDRLPLKNRPYKAQTLPKHVADDPQHLIFRSQNLFWFRFCFPVFVQISSSSGHYLEELLIFRRRRHLLHDKLAHIDHRPVISLV